jgi:hypothetical protein
MKITAGKSFLFLYGLSLALFGLTYLYDPNTILHRYGLTTGGVTGAHVIRAAAGGPLVTVGLALIAGAFLARFRITALWVAVIADAGWVLGRLTSMAVDGVPPRHILLGYLAIEATATVASIWLLRREIAQQPGADVSLRQSAGPLRA